MDNGEKLTNAILVRDNSVHNISESAIWGFLKERGFRLWHLNPDYPTGNWIYISLNEKTYMPELIGINVTEVLGNQAITVEEFLSIYQIYAKYENLEPLMMTHDEEIAKRAQMKIADEKRSRFFKNLC